MLMKRLQKIVFVSLTAWVVIVSLLPFLWMVMTSLKSEADITAIPPTVLPSLSLHFYSSAIASYNIFHYLKNSLIVASATTFITLMLSVFSGYALSRTRLGHKNIILGSLLLVSMFPQISIAGPVWRILYNAGWLNTYQGLIVPYVTLTLPLGIWIMTSFFRELPEELERAALVDGCSNIQTLFRIMIPLSAPGVFTAAILVFIYAWNEFFFALLIMTQRRFQTLPVGIAMFQGQYTIPWGEISAASVIATVPLVLLVFIFQRRIISGLSAGAIKG